jgi:hypothetical protein
LVAGHRAILLGFHRGSADLIDLIEKETKEHGTAKTEYVCALMRDDLKFRALMETLSKNERQLFHKKIKVSIDVIPRFDKYVDKKIAGVGLAEAISQN